MKENREPLQRKVQLTGGSTYTVSLPKEWASEQEIEPGSQVNLYRRGDQLTITRSQLDPEAQRHTTTIDAAERDATTLALTIAAAYIAGCDEIRIRGVTDPEKRQAALNSIRRFIGLEILREETDVLLARTMLDVESLSAEQTLAQLERTALEMHTRAINAALAADGKMGDQISRQDDDVDRLFALVSRGFQQSLVDPAVTMGTGRLTPFDYYMAARQIERVADHAEKIAKIAGRLSETPPNDVAASIQEYGDRARTVVSMALSGLFEDSSQLWSVITDAEELLEEIETLDATLYERNLEDGYLFGLILDSLVRTTQYGVNIAEFGLQARQRDAASS